MISWYRVIIAPHSDLDLLEDLRSLKNVSYASPHTYDDVIIVTILFVPKFKEVGMRMVFPDSVVY